MEELKLVSELSSKHLTKYYRVERNGSQVIIISEMISRGSLSTYLNTFRHPRLSVCQSWFRQILEGLQYLHSHHLTHGHLTCEHVYINSNTGEVKIGDMCLVKLPSVIENRHQSYKPSDDIYYFGLLALEIAFAQILNATKLRKVMSKLYDNPNFDKKRAAKLVKHITEGDYRSLIESCLFADSKVTISDLLNHKFFYSNPVKDENLRSFVKKNIKETRKTTKPRLDLVVTKNSLKDQPQIESNIINVSVKISNADVNSIITFKYNIKKDTPEKIAKEMRENNVIPEEYIIAVQSQIRNVIQDYINELAKSVGQTHEPRISMNLRDNLETMTKLEPATGGNTQREYSTEYTPDTQPQRPKIHNVRIASISGSISPIDTCSAASVNTNITVMENLKAIYAKSNQAPMPKLYNNREEPLQPDVAYSDTLTPRAEYYDEEQNYKEYKRNSILSGVYGKDLGDRKSEGTSEAEEGDKKGAPPI